MLTWHSPTHKGTWADHGVEAAYLGPAEDHLRAFEVWVPNTSTLRITNTVWWFLHDRIVANAPLLDPGWTLAHPFSRVRPTPRDNGTNLIGRAFSEPKLGVCIITGSGPVMQNKWQPAPVVGATAATMSPLIQSGAYFTLTYTQTATGEDHYSSLAEILHRIETCPLLQPPVAPCSQNQTKAPITTPSYVPVTVQFVPHPTPHILASPGTSVTSPTVPAMDTNDPKLGQRVLDVT